MPRKYNENQIKEALELLEKWDGCISKVSSAIGVSPSALKVWAASKEKGLLPKEIAAGSRKRYYKGRTEEDVAEILDYYFSHGMSSIRTRKHFAFAFSDNGLRNWARKDPRWENRHGILDADSEKARKAFEGKGGREPVPSAATADPRKPRPGPRLRQPSPTSRSSRPKTRRSNG